ncbi:MAG: hypothetical protein Salg2KO_19450 [Salibacteraceae bacterium]
MRPEKHLQLKAHNGALYALALGREINTLFSAGADKVVAEWDLLTGEPNAFAIRMEHTVYSLLNLHRRQLIIGTIRGSMHVVDLVSKTEIRHLKFHDKGIFHLAHVQKNNQVIAGCADGSISVWNANDWSLERHLRLTHEKVRRIAITRDESLLAVACGDGRIVLLETGEFKIVDELDGHSDGANSVAFLANNDLISGGKDAHLCKWSAAMGYQRSMDVPAHNFAIYDVVIPSSEAFFATMSRDKTLKLWKIDDWSSPIRLDRASAGGHLNSVNAGIYLEEEQLLATCGDDRSVILWKVN